MVFRRRFKGNLVSTPCLLVASLVSNYHCNIPWCSTCPHMSVQHLAVANVTTLFRRCSTGLLVSLPSIVLATVVPWCHHSIQWYLQLYPGFSTVSLGGFSVTLVSLQYFLLAPLVDLCQYSMTWLKKYQSATTLPIDNWHVSVTTVSLGGYTVAVQYRVVAPLVP